VAWLMFPFSGKSYASWLGNAQKSGAIGTHALPPGALPSAYSLVTLRHVESPVATRAVFRKHVSQRQSWPERCGRPRAQPDTVFNRFRDPLARASCALGCPLAPAPRPNNSPEWEGTRLRDAILRAPQRLCPPAWSPEQHIPDIGHDAAASDQPGSPLDSSPSPCIGRGADSQDHARSPA